MELQKGNLACGNCVCPVEENVFPGIETRKCDKTRGWVREGPEEKVSLTITPTITLTLTLTLPYPKNECRRMPAPMRSPCNMF